MISVTNSRFFVLLRRELQESRNSLVLTPVVLALVLALLMLGTVLMANRITVMGDALLEVIMQEDSISGMNITIKIEDDGDAPARHEYRIEKQQEPIVEDDWNFSREWQFKPATGQKPTPPVGTERNRHSLNPLLSMVHKLMLLVMVLVSAHYLLGALFSDRRDRSILFWKSLPVSEWEEVISKFAVALLVVPGVYIAVSMVAQVVCTLLAMLLVWRMDKDPFELILGNVEFGRLFFNQLTAWLRAALLVAPLYAWLLLASAAARRSPFMFAIAPLIAVLLLEGIFMGSDYLAATINEHLPHFLSDDSTVGADSYGPGWASLNWASLVLGLLFTAAALWGAVYLRRYRFEI